MHLIGRWERVRPYPVATGAYRPPLMLDRKWNNLSPFDCDEWHKTHAGVWVPAIRGGAFSPPGAGTPLNASMALFGSNAGMTASTIALSNAYTFNSNPGQAGAVRYFGLGKAVSNLYYYISAAATGTQANINDINAELRNDQGGVRPNRAAPTLHSSGSADPNGEATWIGWHKIALSAFTDTYATMYWLIVADADGNSTDNATIQYGFGDNTGAIPLTRLLLQAWNSTTGLSTDPTAVAALGNFLLEYSDGTVVGWAPTSHTAVTSNTERKGLRATFTEQIKLWGALMQVATAGTISGLEVYNDDGTAPGGTTQASGTATLPINNGSVHGAILSASYTIPKATAQRYVFTFSGASAQPRKLASGTTNGYISVTRAARMGGPGWYYAWANGTTNWANDDQDAQPDMTLLFEDQVAVAGGGGGARQILSGIGVM